MNEGKKQRKERIKELLREIHEKGEIGELKEEFKDLLREISPLEIPMMEQEMMEEGVDAEEIASMCDIHVELFRESVQDKFDLEGLGEGHPLKSLYLENEEITKDAEKLGLRVKDITQGKKGGKAFGELAQFAGKLNKIGRTHYTREETLLFPYIERRGITSVPEVLWRKHDETREKIKDLLGLLDRDNWEGKPPIEEITETANEVSQSAIDMVFRENNILYPTVKELLSDGEWLAIHNQSRGIGYYEIEPADWNPDVEPKQPYEVTEGIEKGQVEKLPQEIKGMVDVSSLQTDDYNPVRDGDQSLDVGFLNTTELDAIFETLPIDLTFIDANDRVRYFSGGERIFPRTKTVLGRPVQNCHPPDSVDVVNSILEEFKAGNREKAEFWISMGPKFVHIRYFPVRDEEGEYLGTLEVTQDIKEIRELEGERRLLDWD
ncbi:DUF438 domain-containing protein [Candidatus Bipolaricaulota bacterium]|nr:DUF438 domain-containing protein [Candidatus Bipolaricaulota bacterium]